MEGSVVIKKGGEERKPNHEVHPKKDGDENKLAQRKKRFACVPHMMVPI